jgi:hypothetical protein
LWQGRANEVARLGHDQVRLQRLRLVFSEIHKRYSIVSQRSRIARLIVPNLKVHYLGSTDTQGDFQYFRASYLLAESGVKTGAGLLDKSKVESCREGDG